MDPDTFPWDPSPVEAQWVPPAAVRIHRVPRWQDVDPSAIPTLPIRMAPRRISPIQMKVLRVPIILQVPLGSPPPLRVPPP